MDETTNTIDPPGNVTGGSDAGSTDQGTTQTPPATTPGDANATGSTSDGNSFGDFIPAEYKDRGWAKNFEGKPLDDFFKSYDNAQTTIGKLNNEFRVPGENASQEQIQQFRKAMGVPETPDAYVMPEVQWADNEKVSGDFLKQTRTPEFENDLKQLALKAGLTPKQWSELSEGYDRTFAKHHAKQLEERAKAVNQISEDFSVEAELLWGDKTDQVLDDVKRIVDKYADKSKPHIADMPNKYLLMMSEVIERFRRDVMPEDRFRESFPVRANADSSTRDGLRKQAQALMSNPDYLKDPSSPKGKEIQAEIDRLYNEMAKFR